MTVDKTETQNLKSLALLTLRSAYRTFRPALGPGTCRFHPSCSEYAFQALGRHGILKGTRLAASRLSRCRPFSPGGYDPVP
ncbi:MAG: membrane protein insertion efficiency factor YidD [Elusimicrobiales bacterium]|nr:membrane protein insertion efficiency factor YidD [Elusimicrobiales bacterium]